MYLQAILKLHQGVEGIGFAGKDLLGELFQLAIEVTFQLLQFGLPEGGIGFASLAFHQNPALGHPTIGLLDLPHPVIIQVTGDFGQRGDISLYQVLGSIQGQRYPR